MEQRCFSEAVDFGWVAQFSRSRYRPVDSERRWCGKRLKPRCGTAPGLEGRACEHRADFHNLPWQHHLRDGGGAEDSALAVRVGIGLIELRERAQPRREVLGSNNNRKCDWPALAGDCEFSRRVSRGGRRGSDCY